jgi:hypothetical protein
MKIYQDFDEIKGTFGFYSKEKVGFTAKMFEYNFVELELF